MLGSGMGVTTRTQQRWGQRGSSERDTVTLRRNNLYRHRREYESSNMVLECDQATDTTTTVGIRSTDLAGPESHGFINSWARCKSYVIGAQPFYACRPTQQWSHREGPASQEPGCSIKIRQVRDALSLASNDAKHQLDVKAKPDCTAVEKQSFLKKVTWHKAKERKLRTEIAGLKMNTESSTLESEKKRRMKKAGILIDALIRNVVTVSHIPISFTVCCVRETRKLFQI